MALSPEPIRMPIGRSPSIATVGEALIPIGGAIHVGGTVGGHGGR